MSGLILSQALLWIVIAVLCVVVLALARQIGVLHERIAPVGALVTDNGPEVGQLAPRFEMPTLDGAP
jgi:methylamine dehydrogenase accessory protein MauD